MIEVERAANLSLTNLSLETRIVEGLGRVLGSPEAKLSLHEPTFRGREWDYVKECLDTGWVSSVGKFVDRFEKMLSEICQVPYAVAAVNGTAALQMAGLVAEVKAGDEVLIPALTFVATTNAFTYLGAIAHFVDSEAQTLGVCPEKLRSYLLKISVLRGGECFNRATGRRIRALVVMHAFGHPARIEELAEVAREFSLVLIEDSAEAIGSKLGGRHLGSHGLISTLSFNGNKIITTGGGGALLFRDEKLAKRAKHLSTTAKVPHAWEFEHDEVGYNFRLPNLNAALGCAQLEQLPVFLAKKRRLAHAYRAEFANEPRVRFLDEPKGAESNFWLNAIVLREPNLATRDQILAATNAAGFMTRPTWRLMHELPMYAANPRDDLSVAEGLEASIVNIPSSVILEERLA